LFQQFRDVSVRKQVARAVFGEADVNRVKQRENNEEAESEQARKQVAKSVGARIEIDVETRGDQAENHNALPTVPGLVRKKVQVQHWQNYQHRDNQADGGNSLKPHRAMFLTPCAPVLRNGTSIYVSNDETQK
jgi:hypothetical protein